MAVTKKTIITVTCDHCDNVIENSAKFLSIGDHGLTFHLSCFTGMNPGELLYHMGHDESVIHTIQADGTLKEESLRLRDPLALLPDGSIDWSRPPRPLSWRQR